MSLECICGTELFEPDDDGRYTPDTEAWCPGCGRKNIIDVAQRFNDDGPYDVACVVTLEEQKP